MPGRGERPKILFVSTGNAGRSQMAEGYCRAYFGYRADAYSAGVQPALPDPRIEQVMAEVGIFVGGSRTKHISEFEGTRFDVVLTMSPEAQNAADSMDIATRKYFCAFPDPRAQASADPDEKEALETYRRIRDGIRGFLVTFVPTALSIDRQTETN